MLIQCEHFISKKIYYLEVHVQKTGQFHYPVSQIAKQSVSDTFVIVVLTRLLSHHIKKGGKRILLTLKISKTFDSPKHSSSLLKCKLKHVTFPSFKPKR